MLVVVTIIFCIVLILLFFSSLTSKAYIMYEINNDKKEYFYDEMIYKQLTSESKIPKFIWTFWDSDPPNVVLGCIKTWIDNNPDHNVIILSKKNYTKYIDPITNLEKLNIIQHVSDVIRLNILSKYGGIWIDASIICSKGLSWVHTIQKNKNVDFVGYYMSWFTNDDKYPVIENWFMGCVPHCPLISDIVNEINVILNEYSNFKEYLEKNNVNTQNIPTEYIEYMWIHSIIQKLLRENEYKYHVIDCLSSAFLYIQKHNWNTHEAMKDLANNMYDYPVIKFRSHERNFLINNPDIADKIFSNYNVSDVKILNDLLKTNLDIISNADV